jgi:hypothetical protein
MGGNYTFFSISPPRLIFLTTVLGSLSSAFRSRAALELENHQVGVLQYCAKSGEQNFPPLPEAGASFQ